MDQDTIIVSSSVGKRLSGVMRDDKRMLVFGEHHIRLVGKLTIGRHSSCHIQIDNTLVSRKHAMIQKIKDDFFITDLNSTNGTFVNGQRVPAKKYIKLEPGDSVQIGKTILVLQ